tara:strand:- start:92 stop:619 length:528 start_codon:yes stop_codon:yes gene_type:complete
MKKILLIFVLILCSQNIFAETKFNDLKDIKSKIVFYTNKNIQSMYDVCITDTNFTPDKQQIYCTCLVKQIPKNIWIEQAKMDLYIITDFDIKDLLNEKFQKTYREKSKFCLDEKNYLKYENNIYLSGDYSVPSKKYLRLEKAMKDNFVTWIIVIFGMIAALRITISAIFKKSNKD